MVEADGVLLDTCVLWPNLQRDFLLSLAVEGTFDPLWSEDILGELEEAEFEKLRDRGVSTEEASRRTAHLVSNMRAHFAGAIVGGFAHLIGTFDLPDPDDEHVVAAAVVGGARLIVTDNVRHFPSSRVPSTIAVKRPREFAVELVADHPELALAAVAKIATRPRSTRSVNYILDELEKRYAMGDSVEILRSLAS